MKNIITIAFLFLSFVTCQSCNETSSDSTDFDAVSETIASHNATIIFVGTSWCAATQNTIKEQVIPYLSNQKEDIGFVFLYFGTLDGIPDDLLKNITLIELESFGGIIDKTVANRNLSKVLNNYKRVNYVPYSILVDHQGNILNYDANEKRYSGLYEIGQIIDSLE